MPHFLRVFFVVFFFGLGPSRAISSFLMQLYKMRETIVIVQHIPCLLFCSSGVNKWDLFCNFSLTDCSVNLYIVERASYTCRHLILDLKSNLYFKILTLQITKVFFFFFHRWEIISIKVPLQFQKTPLKVSKVPESETSLWKQKAPCCKQKKLPRTKIVCLSLLISSTWNVKLAMNH